MTTEKNSKLSKLPIPTRDGYSFDGWFTARSDGTKVTTNTIFSTSTTIYVQWTKKETPSESTSKVYTITFDPNGGTLNDSAAMTTDKSGKLSKFPTPTCDNLFPHGGRFLISYPR